MEDIDNVVPRSRYTGWVKDDRLVTVRDVAHCTTDLSLEKEAVVGLEALFLGGVGTAGPLKVLHVFEGLLKE